MTQPPREIDQALRRTLFVKHCRGPAIVIAALWIAYAATVFFGVDVIHLLKHFEKREGDPKMMLIITAAFSMLFVGVAVLRTRRAITLARCGEEVEGTVARYGPFSYHGMMRVECTYKVGGAEHVFISSMHRDLAPALGETVVLLVDPGNPKHCMFIEDVFADRKQEVRRREKTVWERSFEYGLYSLAALSAAFLVWQYFAKAGAKPPAMAAAPLQANPPAPQVQPPKPYVKPPGKEIVFRPMFVWETGEPTCPGSGFFVKAPGGKVAAVTCSHFLDRDGPRLLEARWLIPADRKATAVFDRSWGKPGAARVTRMIVGRENGGKPITMDVDDPDKRTDYLLMPARGGVPPGVVLELDSRPSPEVGERVYFHDIDTFGQKDYAVVEGEVAVAAPEGFQVMLFREIEPKSQCGSPVISQVTGKVVGLVAATGESDAGAGGLVMAALKAKRGQAGNAKQGAEPTRRLRLTPAGEILKTLEEEKEFPPLRDVIGKKTDSSRG
jgi:hypothetical protein